MEQTHAPYRSQEHAAISWFLLQIKLLCLVFYFIFSLRKQTRFAQQAGAECALANPFCLSDVLPGAGVHVHACSLSGVSLSWDLRTAASLLWHLCQDFVITGWVVLMAPVLTEELQLEHWCFPALVAAPWLGLVDSYSSRWAMSSLADSRTSNVTVSISLISSIAFPWLFQSPLGRQRQPGGSLTLGCGFCGA